MDGSADPSAIDGWFHRLLGRPPNGEERLRYAGLDAEALVTAITDFAEYRNRFRDTDPGNDSALVSAQLWPIAQRDYDLQIAVISSEGLSKCLATVNRIIPELGPRTLLTLICGEAEDGQPLSGPNIEHIILPGRSVFEIRAALPTLLKEVGWVALMEDHAVPHEGWVAAVEGAVKDAPPDQIAFTSMVTNRISTSAWSWASFLFNFAYHWYPSASPRLPGTVTTLVFRRDLLGRRALPIHAFEQFILGRQGPAVAGMVVDHNQPLGWWTASYHTFDNGRVTGSALRRHQESPRRAMRNMIAWANRGRIREIRALLAQHPERAQLPPGTLMRLRWISACHGLGVVLGTVFGGGGAHHRLE
jgi:hypothetical protein